MSFDLTTYEGAQAARKQLWADGKDAPYFEPGALAQAALWLADHGVDVFPLKPGTKEPLENSRGHLGATHDPEVVFNLWDENPQANIGVRTGEVLNIIDVDGRKGFDSLQRVIDAGLMPETFGVLYTPTKGGIHFVIKPDGSRRKIGMLPGLDGLGIGGYSIFPPSHIPGAGHYVWLEALDLEGLTA